MNDVQQCFVSEMFADQKKFSFVLMAFQIHDSVVFDLFMRMQKILKFLAFFDGKTIQQQDFVIF
jgi:hypothetical protein